MSEDEQVKKADLEVGTIVDRYRVKKLIGAGGFGNIYSVYDIEDNDKLYAMKIIESTNLSNLPDENSQKSKTKQNKKEKKTFYDIAFENPDFIENEVLYSLKDDNGVHFPDIFAEGKYMSESNTNNNSSNSPFVYIIMSLFGPSLGLLKLLMTKKRFSPFTSTKVAIDMLNCIQVFHDRGYVHNDIKPGNFLIQSNSQSPVVLIDFGLSIKYLTEPHIDQSKNSKKKNRSKINRNDNLIHIKIEKNLGFTGTLKYASINAHNGILLSRRDDLYSWFYSILELASGDVPWGDEEDYNITLKMKKNVSKFINEVIELHCLPPEFKLVYKYITSLSFEERPNYDSIRGTLRKALRKLDGSGNNDESAYAYHKYDWELIDKTALKTITDVPTDIPKPSFSYSPYFLIPSNENDNNNNNNNNYSSLAEEKEVDLNEITTEGGCNACILI